MALTNVSSGATKVSKVLNAVNQEATIWCAGQAKVGINIFSVTGTPTLSFFGSLDGLTYNPITVGPYPSAAPSAAGVTTTTAAGTFEVPVQNYQFIRVQMTSGAGPASVVITASVDGSYQEAFNPPTNIGVSLAVGYPSTTSTAVDTNTMAIPAQANRTINLTFCEVSMTGPGFGGRAMFSVWDGAVGNGVPLFSDWLTSPVGSVGSVQLINLPTDAQGNKGIQGTPGSVMTLQIRNLGTVSSIINARVSYL